MENVYLGRKEAPVGADTWKLLDSIMIEAAKSQLAGRRLLALDGPVWLWIEGPSALLTVSWKKGFLPVRWFLFME